MFGFALLAFNTFLLSQITLTTSFGALKLLLVVRGLALGCTMQPTQLSAMSVVPPQLQTNASSLITAMRNVFQSFGVAMLSTVVTTQSVVHSTILSWNVRPDTVPGQALTTAKRDAPADRRAEQRRRRHDRCEPDAQSGRPAGRGPRFW